MTARGTLGTPKKRATFLAAIAKGMSVDQAAALIGAGRRTVYHWRCEDAVFRQAWDEAIDACTDALEAKLQELALAGDVTALIFILRSRKAAVYNPNLVVRLLESDAVYTRFITHPPHDSVVQHVTWKDNPWFPPELARESAELKARDFDAWMHVYGGRCRASLDGAIYARELREAEEDGRIRSVPYDPTKPVNVYCDIGWADNTSLLFVQHIAGEIRIIDAHQDSGRAWPHYLMLLQQRGYVIGTVWLPHDAQATELGTGRSIEEMTRAGGWRVRIVPRLEVADGISATRTAFPTMFFDRERCADALQALRHYRFDIDERGQLSRKPLHDHASHFADATRCCAVAMTEQRRATYKERPKPPPVPVSGRGNFSWLGR